ncbi:hypothetical protein C8R44DRAFT_881781 [Mycena epipterygia]|nr:hypothetical protein C8R44DRAFT_881781 [Mycena epipterygia]
MTEYFSLSLSNLTLAPATSGPSLRSPLPPPFHARDKSLCTSLREVSLRALLPSPISLYSLALPPHLSLRSHLSAPTPGSTSNDGGGARPALYLPCASPLSASVIAPIRPLLSLSLSDMCLPVPPSPYLPVASHSFLIPSIALHCLTFISIFHCLTLAPPLFPVTSVPAQGHRPVRSTSSPFASPHSSAIPNSHSQYLSFPAVDIPLLF